MRDRLRAELEALSHAVTGAGLGAGAKLGA